MRVVAILVAGAVVCASLEATARPRFRWGRGKGSSAPRKSPGPPPRLGEVEALLHLADVDRSPSLRWTREIASNPGSDWGYHGLARVAAERHAAVGRLAAARGHLRGASGPEVEAALTRIEAAETKLEGTIRRIRSGQMAELMRFEERGFPAPMTRDGIRELLPSLLTGVTDPRLDALVTRYRARAGNVLSADEAKELFPEYARSKRTRLKNAAQVHDRASAVVKETYRRMLAEPVPQGKRNLVVFLAGGPGAGKTTVLESVPEVKALRDQAHIVYDSMAAETASTVDRVEQALDAGKEVHVIYVHRDPVDAMRSGIVPRALATGRSIPASVTANGYAGAVATVLRLVHGYAGEPRVKVTILDNRRVGHARIAGPEILEGSRFHEETLHGELVDTAITTEVGGRDGTTALEAILKGSRVPGRKPTAPPDRSRSAIPARKMGQVE